MIPHAVFEELAAGHALHALEPEDEQLFLAHLSGCALCERELARHEETAAHLALGLPAADVPDEVFGRLRAAVTAESGEGVFAGSPAPPVDLAAARARRRPRWAAVVAAAAAVVLVGGLAASNAALRQDRAQQSVASGRLEDVVRSLSQEPGRTVPLRDGASHVRAVAVVHADRVDLVLEGLQPNDATSTYVLWEQAPTGGVRPLKAFDVGDGPIQVVRGIPVGTAAAGFAITHEHGRTAPAQPQVAPLASGAVA